jgi:hypothetical protein
LLTVQHQYGGADRDDVSRGFRKDPRRFGVRNNASPHCERIKKTGLLRRLRSSQRR